MQVCECMPEKRGFEAGRGGSFKQHHKRKVNKQKGKISMEERTGQHIQY